MSIFIIFGTLLGLLILLGYIVFPLLNRFAYNYKINNMKLYKLEKNSVFGTITNKERWFSSDEEALQENCNFITRIYPKYKQLRPQIAGCGECGSTDHLGSKCSNKDG